MHFIDLHCDTLYKSATLNVPLDDPQMEVKQQASLNNHRLQCYAIWLPDELSGEEAENLFYKACNILKHECDRLGIRLIDNDERYSGQINNFESSAFFTVENGSALNSNIANIKKFANHGVRILTLTWNNSNPLGDGAMVKKSVGLTDFGKAAVIELEKCGIIIDVSHASDKLFYDVAELAKKPFIATHSNSRHITANPRNLTDDQIKIIIDCGGLIGLNFHNAFLNNIPDKANISDIIKHIEYFMSLGAENSLCFGTDFDGCTLPSDMKDSNCIDNIYELLLKHNYKESILRKIFYENADKFFENFDNQRIM